MRRFFVVYRMVSSLLLTLSLFRISRFWRSTLPFYCGLYGTVTFFSDRIIWVHPFRIVCSCLQLWMFGISTSHSLIRDGDDSWTCELTVYFYFFLSTNVINHYEYLSSSWKAFHQINSNTNNFDRILQSFSYTMVIVLSFLTLPSFPQCPGDFHRLHLMWDRVNVMEL